MRIRWGLYGGYGMATEFIKLNENWNAEPNAPYPSVSIQGADLRLWFLLNPFMYEQFKEGDFGTLTFKNCWRYRLGWTNDEGWSRGQCRFSNLAPKWGEFYEIKGDILLSKSPEDWHVIGPPIPESRHYLFYFRSDTFECDAESWSLEIGHGEFC